MYFQCTSNLAYGRVWTRADGHSWVCMGALGRVSMGEHKNQTSIDTMGPDRVRIWMNASGIFPKIHTCGHRHEMRIIRDSGGQGWVGWVQGGASMHSKRKTRSKDSLGVSMTWFRQAYMGAGITNRMVWSPHDHCREYWGDIRGVSGSQITPIYPQTIKSDVAQQKTRKRTRTIEFNRVTKLPKNGKRGKQHNNSQKRGDKRENGRTRRTERSRKCINAKDVKEADRKHQKLRQTGNYCCQKTCKNTQSKVVMNKMSKKN